MQDVHPFISNKSLANMFSVWRNKNDLVCYDEDHSSEEDQYSIAEKFCADNPEYLELFAGDVSSLYFYHE